MESANTTSNEPDTWVITDALGNIIDVSSDAAAMLNISRLHLRRRSLLMFFAADRPVWTRLLRLAAQGQQVQRMGAMRPRDRRVRPVQVELREVPSDPGMKAVEWRFRLAELQHLSATG